MRRTAGATRLTDARAPLRRERARPMTKKVGEATSRGDELNETYNDP